MTPHFPHAISSRFIHSFTLFPHLPMARSIRYFSLRPTSSATLGAGDGRWRYMLRYLERGADRVSDGESDLPTTHIPQQLPVTTHIPQSILRSAFWMGVQRKVMCRSELITNASLARPRSSLTFVFCVRGRGEGGRGGGEGVWTSRGGGMIKEGLVVVGMGVGMGLWNHINIVHTYFQGLIRII